MTEAADWLLGRLTTRKCRGCEDRSPHSHHLTWFGELRYTDQLDHLREKIEMAVAWRLPRWLVYWATVRAGAHATTGRWASVETPKTTIMDVLERWRSR